MEDGESLSSILKYSILNCVGSLFQQRASLVKEVPRGQRSKIVLK